MKKRDPFLMSRLRATWAARGRPRGVTVATVVHDDRCPRLRGGECACTPTIRVSGARASLSPGGSDDRGHS
jgi:hypothetical protein